MMHNVKQCMQQKTKRNNFSTGWEVQIGPKGPIFLCKYIHG